MTRPLFRTNSAGRVTICVGKVSVHVLPRTHINRFWGYRKDYFECLELHDIGLGPVAMICWWTEPGC